LDFEIGIYLVVLVVFEVGIYVNPVRNFVLAGSEYGISNGVNVMSFVRGTTIKATGGVR